ncbi:MAG: sensor histidine kinase [Bacteroidetes bacterium]|nr:sensor histidine kinase [Bacteroidota bacterium]MBS1650300.1 sensor histidine kinase [Bacteroidota bacterium]
MRKSNKIVFAIVHVALWACFIALPFIFFADFYKALPGRIGQRIIVGHLIATGLLIIFYYFNTSILIPKLLFKAKWWAYAGIVICCFVAFLYAPESLVNLTLGPRIDPKMEFRVVPRGSDSTIKNTLNQPQTQNKNQQDKKFNTPPSRKINPFRFYPPPYTIFLLIFAIGTSISVMQRWLHAERTNQEIRNEKLNTELSFLKSQVNPHFFFNTLNNIYSLAVVGSEQTANAVLKLASIMRYILTETQIDEVPLANEVEFIKNFIDLQLVRLTDKVKINFICEGLIEQKKIAPLLFISFIENSFKYGVSTKEKTEINIQLNAKEKEINFHISNTIVKADNGIQDTTGIGINNVKRRLELLYPEKHNLIVKEENNQFIVQLNIKTT